MLCLWGGNANNGTHCGLGYSNSNNAFSNSNTNIGARLTYERNRRGRKVCKRKPPTKRVSQTLVVTIAYSQKISAERLIRASGASKFTESSGQEK